MSISGLIADAAFALLLATALFLMALGAIALMRPQRARAFLLGFATSPGKHYLELLVRAAVGTAFLIHAEHATFGDLFRVLGWILCATTAMLALLPWHWHQRFAAFSVPRALHWLPLIGYSALAFGIGLGWALLLH